MKFEYWLTICGFVGVFCIALYTQIDWKTELKTNVGFNPYREDVFQNNTSHKYMMMVDGKLAPYTILTPEQLKIQETQGCMGSCHKDMK